jgi:GxxExxY protein
MRGHDDLAERIIGAAIDVHRTLGPGFVESIYETALALELSARGLPMERQSELQVRYRGHVVGVHRLDLVVGAQIVVELKAVRSIEPVHYGIVRSYLRAAGLKHGLLLNFGSAPLDTRRVTID